MPAKSLYRELANELMTRRFDRRNHATCPAKHKEWHKLRNLLVQGWTLQRFYRAVTSRRQDVTWWRTWDFSGWPQWEESPRLAVGCTASHPSRVVWHGRTLVTDFSLWSRCWCAHGTPRSRSDFGTRCGSCPTCAANYQRHLSVSFSIILKNPLPRPPHTHLQICRPFFTGWFFFTAQNWSKKSVDVEGQHLNTTFRAIQSSWKRNNNGQNK